MKALIFGITGQDGSYLAELLLRKGYEVSGIRRWTSIPTTSRIDHLLKDIQLLDGDITDAASVYQVVSTVKPDEIYNLASISSTSFPTTDSIIQVNGVGALNIYHAAMTPHVHTKVFQASSSEIFDLSVGPQDENTRHAPSNIYGSAKLLAHDMARIYRDRYGLFISCGILFNHESPRRTEGFVSRKITSSAVRIHRGKQKKLELWDLSSYRDWGFAGDYVEAMWRMLQKDRATDYVIGTGEPHTVKDFVAAAFGVLGMDWRDHVVETRPGGKGFIAKANIQKANICLNWKPTVNFAGLIRMMVEHDLQC